MTPHKTPSWYEAFRVEVRHACFFDGRVGASVAWLPVGQTAAQLAALGLVYRVVKGALSVMRADDASSHPPADWLFQLTATDPWFGHYTDLDLADPSTTLWFDTAMAPPADSGNLRKLHSGATVSSADRVAWRALPIQGALTQHAPHESIGFVRVRYAPDDPPAMPWLIAFDAGEVVWQYLVRGASGRAIFIRDQDGQVEFEPAAPAPLQGDAEATVMRSKVAVALKERSPRRFQLMEATPQGERVLIDALPVASPRALAKETVNGRDLTEAMILVDL